MREKARERGQVRRDEGKAGMRRIKIQRTMMLFELKREEEEEEEEEGGVGGRRGGGGRGG